MEDDIAFVDCLYCNSKVNSLNASVIRNSSQLKISSRLTLNSKDIDPDKYFYNAHQITGDQYYLEDDFNCMNINNSRFSVLHINARSLKRNTDKNKLYLSMLNHLFTIIAVSETWETTLIAMHFHIPSYTIVSVPRSNDNKCKGGGVKISKGLGILAKLRHCLPSYILVNLYYTLVHP